jgi:hypothetical protein
MHKNAVGHSRLERVRQVVDKDKSIYNFASYVPVGNAVTKLRSWKDQGADILYLSSHKKPKDIEMDKLVLRSHGFPEGQVFFREANEEYKDVAERALPDILIEDDCESIGGVSEMTFPHIRPELKAKIKSIVLKEFGGLDHLPDKISALVS